MKRILNSQNFPHDTIHPVVALGNFDGVHVAHRLLISETLKKARDIGGASVVYTFDPHPVKVLASAECPPLIQTLEQRIASIESLGVDICVIETFTEKFAHQDAAEFFGEVIVSKLRAREIVIGYDFTFGLHRRGSVQTLAKLGEKTQVKVNVIDAQFLNETLVSSTNIRRLVMHGDVSEAAVLLGRPYSITGCVVKGHGIGRELGARTANIESENKLLPENGVYLTVTRMGEAIYPSITSIGTNPTFHNFPFSIETHMIDSKIEALGRTATIEFFKKMRDQIAFGSQEELKEQIKKDIDAARILHEGRKT